MKRFTLLFACVLSASAFVRAAGVTVPKLDGDSKDASYAEDLLVDYQSSDTIDFSGPGLSLTLTDVTLDESKIESYDLSFDSHGMEHAHETLTGTATVTDPDAGDTETLSGTMDVDIDPGPAGGALDTTLTGMDFTGTLDGVSIEIKNDPSQTPPTGQTTITGSGPFTIHSFFDVFVELSIDGGSTIVPATSNGSGTGGSTEFDLVGGRLVPLPAALPAGLGLLAAIAIARRSRVGKV